MPNIKYNLNATTANNFNSLLINAGYTNAVLNQESVYFTLSEISEEKYNAAVHIAFLKDVAARINTTDHNVVKTESNTVDPHNTGKIYVRKYNNGLLSFEEVSALSVPADKEWVVLTHRYTKLDLVHGILGTEVSYIPEDNLDISALTTSGKFDVAVASLLSKNNLYQDPESSGSTEILYRPEETGTVKYGEVSTINVVPSVTHGFSSLKSDIKVMRQLDLSKVFKVEVLRFKFLKDVSYNGASNLPVYNMTFNLDQVKNRFFENGYYTEAFDARKTYLESSGLGATELFGQATLADTNDLEKAFTEEERQVITENNLKLVKLPTVEIPATLTNKVIGSRDFYAIQSDISSYPKEFIDYKPASVNAEFSFSTGALANASGTLALIAEHSEVKSEENAEEKLNELVTYFKDTLGLGSYLEFGSINQGSNTYDNSSATVLVTVKDEAKPFITGEFAIVVEYDIKETTVEKDLSGFDGQPNIDEDALPSEETEVNSIDLVPSLAGYTEIVE